MNIDKDSIQQLALDTHAVSPHWVPRDELVQHINSVVTALVDAEVDAVLQSLLRDGKIVADEFGGLSPQDEYKYVPRSPFPVNEESIQLALWETLYVFRLRRLDAVELREYTTILLDKRLPEFVEATVDAMDLPKPPEPEPEDEDGMEDS